VLDQRAKSPSRSVLFDFIRVSAFFWWNQRTLDREGNPVNESLSFQSSVFILMLIICNRMLRSTDENKRWLKMNRARQDYRWTPVKEEKWLWAWPQDWNLSDISKDKESLS
jgi:hypothetical protein